MSATLPARIFIEIIVAKRRFVQIIRLCGVNFRAARNSS